MFTCLNLSDVCLKNSTTHHLLNSIYINTVIVCCIKVRFLSCTFKEISSNTFIEKSARENLAEANYRLPY